MPDYIIHIAGWIPAFIFPAATLIQLRRIAASTTVAGVSPTTWSLFGIANICLYIYTEKYTAFQPIFGLLGTATADFAIVALVLVRRRRGEGR